MLWLTDHLQKGIQTPEQKTTAETIAKNKTKKWGAEGEDKNGDERAMDGKGKSVQLETTTG